MDSVFANHYLYDMSTENLDGFHHLEPVFVAQILVNMAY